MDPDCVVQPALWIAFDTSHDGPAMNANRFWQIIEAARADADDDEQQVELIYERLKTLTPDEIVSFDRLYDEYRFRAFRWDLWGAAHLMNGGCSDDGFEYFRGWLISRGRAVYERALEDPDSLAAEVDPEQDDYELESLLYASMRAYEEVAGEPMPARDRRFPEIAGTPWEESDLDGLLPRLAECTSDR